MSKSFEEVERKILASMIEQRDLLNKSIAALEYNLEHPPEPVDIEKVMAWVDDRMEEGRQMDERFYQKLLKEEREGTLSLGGKSLLKDMKKERVAPREKEVIHGNRV